MTTRPRANDRLRIGIISLAQPAWLAGQSLTEVMVDALLHARDPEREDLILISPEWAATPREGLEILHLPPADLSLPSKARRASLRVRDRYRSLPGEWALRRRLHLAEPSNPIHVARLADVDVAIPVTALHAPGIDLRCIGWIPDFQQRYLPEMFSADEIAVRNASQGDLAAGVARMILSSRDTARQFAEIYPDHAHKVRVASFPSQFAYRPPPTGNPREVLAKYGLPDKFALVVNQFWAHKNHGVLIDALQRLTEQGRPVPLVLVGGLGDYRDLQGTYLSSLLQKIARAHVSQHLFLLGRVPGPDLLALLRCAAVVVQPSRFEGWNTTVEDALALGRPIVCSSLDVHREQARGDAGFFGWDQPDQLADLLAEGWKRWTPGPDPVREAAGLAEEGRVAARYGEVLIGTCREVAGA